MLIGLDLGTTGCKGSLFNENGKIISEAYIEYPLINTPEGYIEQDANQWWSLTCEIIRSIISKAGADPRKVSALGISTQGIAFVPVDKEGNTLHNAFSWLDTRSAEETGFIKDAFGEDHIYKITGKRISPAYSITKILWFKKNMPELYNKTWKFLLPLDFLNYKLTGRAVTDHSIASGTMAYNINTRQWDEDILNECRISRDKLPEVAALGTNVGFITSTAAAETGLSCETAVILGAQDQKCAAIGAGISKGICTASLGTATAVEAISEVPLLDKKLRIPCFALDESNWVAEAVIATSGVSLKWVRNALFSEKSFSELDTLAANTRAGSGSVFFFPHLEGASSPCWKPEAKGSFYGISLSTAAGDLLRSVLEGIAFQIRSNIEVMEEMGIEIHEIRLYGGGSKSPVWCQIIADITGKKVITLSVSEAAVYGAAMIAAKGIFCTGFPAANEIKPASGSYVPNPVISRLYDNIYLDYTTIQSKIY